MNIFATLTDPAATMAVTRRLDRRVYPARRPDGVQAPLWVDARVEHAHDVKKAAAGACTGSEFRP